MATTKVKSAPKLLTAGKWWHMSPKRLLIAGSVTLNIAFIVLMFALLMSNSLDGLFMPNGLERYCSSVNDDKFKNSTDQVKALRDYVCDRPDANQYFQDGLIKYLDSKGISHATNE